MIKIAILDDDITFLDLLENKIEDYFYNKNLDFSVTPFSNPTDLIDLYLNSERFDYLFIDYDLPEIDGYNLGKVLRKYDDEFKLIYLSAYENVVFRCIENSIFRFIRKSNLNRELINCLNAISEKYLLESKVFQLKTDNGMISFTPNQILYFEYENRNVFLNTKIGRTKIYNVTLKEIYEKFEKYHFIYICRGIIVNLAFADRIEKEHFVLINNSTLKISRRKLPEVQEQYTNYLIKQI